MIKKLIIILAILVAGWLILTYYNSQNPNEEIIGADTQTANTETIIKEENNQQGTTTEETESIKELAKKYCDNMGVSTVLLSEEFIKVVSGLPGSGSSYYPIDGGSRFSCPVVAPNSMTEECKETLEVTENEWEIICEN